MPAAAQARDEPLIVRHRVSVAVERQHDNRPRRFGRRDDRALDRAQRREQARDANREAGRRHRLGAEARHEAVVAPAAADRAEADRPAVLARRLEGQLRFEDGAGVIFEAAHDGSVDQNSIFACIAAAASAAIHAMPPSSLSPSDAGSTSVAHMLARSSRRSVRTLPFAGTASRFDTWLSRPSEARSP